MLSFPPKIFSLRFLLTGSTSQLTFIFIILNIPLSQTSPAINRNFMQGRWVVYSTVSFFDLPISFSQNMWFERFNLLSKEHISTVCCSLFLVVMFLLLKVLAILFGSEIGFLHGSKQSLVFHFFASVMANQPWRSPWGLVCSLWTFLPFFTGLPHRCFCMLSFLLQPPSL